jgi:hypothetical protein
MTTPALGFVPDRVCSCHAQYRQRFRRPRQAANVTLLSLSPPQRSASNGNELNAFLVTSRPCAKAESPPKTRHDCALFFDRLQPPYKNISIVVDFAASSSLYDDALIHAPRGHPTAAAAAQLMRRIMIDHARRGRTQRVASGRRVKQKAATR